uniref:Uncharacterized protein n=1 Tax=viral metagenome TaxID=1070528 RepID=A0A6C0B8J9_9ZZZZ
MNCDLRSWTIEYPDYNDDIEILKECCKHNDDILLIADKKMAHLKDKLPQPFYNSILSSYLLNKTKENYCVLEKYVYDITMFHLTRLGFQLHDDIHVQFWMKSGKNSNLCELHRDWYTDYENKGEKRAFLSTITYLEDNDIPTLISDVTINEYKERKFDKMNKIALSFPRAGKHISFLGRDYFHGHYSVFPVSDYSNSRCVLVVKLWDGLRPPLRYFDNELFLLDNVYNKREPLLKFVDSKPFKNITSTIDEDLFKSLLFSAEADTCYEIGKKLKTNGYYDADNFIIEDSGVTFFYILLFICCLIVVFFYFWESVILREMIDYKSSKTA